MNTLQPYGTRGPVPAQDGRAVYQVVRHLWAADGSLGAALPVAECMSRAGAEAHAAALNDAHSAWADRCAA